ncbi:hypothetical protein V1264_020896 [Littorina saxatilis]|uniref:C-type lectin domain-containing protein n=1 Tax=Littorina saxatilis TaxID=31220 RepID=A0AAN9BDJ8_9CAEN
MKYSSFLCEIALILFRNCVFLGEITAQANAESRQYHWTKYAVKGEKIISSSVSSFPSGSLQACAVLSTAFSKFSYDFEQKICYLEPTLQNSPSVNSEVHFLLTFATSASVATVTPRSTRSALVRETTSDATVESTNSAESSDATLRSTNSAESSDATPRSTSSALVSETTSDATLRSTNSAESSDATLRSTNSGLISETTSDAFVGETTKSTPPACPGYEGYFLMPGGSSCIRVYSTDSSTDYTTWDDAAHSCAPTATLVRIKDTSKMDAVNGILVAIGVKQTGKWYWVDATDNAQEGHFVWGDSTPLDPQLFQSGQPDNGTNAGRDPPVEENCVYLMSHNMQLADYPCFYYNAYICEVVL